MSTSGARVGVVHEIAARVRVVHESTEWCTRVRSGVRVVHEINFSRLGMDLQEKQLLLSKARTRAAGGREVKTGEEEL